MPQLCGHDLDSITESRYLLDAISLVPCIIILNDICLAGTTFLLSLELSASESNVYTIYASALSPAMTFPAAYNSPLASSSGDIGVPPVILPEDDFDSWLTVGNVDREAISSLGIDTSAWSTNGLHVVNGAVFLMDPENGEVGTALIAQLTGNYGCAESVVINAQGKSTVGPDWEQWQRQGW